MQTDKKLTISIPTFDREDFLRQALESIENQSMQDFEVILFDNASPYNVKALINEFPSLEISLLCNTENIGNQANFKKVMSYNYNTPYVMIFHDDDTLHPSYLTDAIAILENDKKIIWVGSIIRFVLSGTKDINKFPKLTEKSSIVTYNKKELADAFMSRLHLGFSSVIYRTETLKETVLDVQRFHKWLDRPYLLEALGYDKAAVLHFPYVHYRIHKGQDSSKSYRNHIDTMVNLIDYLKNTGSPGLKTDKFTTTSSLRTAIANACSISDFGLILSKFHDRDLYRTRNISAYAIYWSIRTIINRL